ncbi:hypothetical protein NL676_034719 [Syzygium grande]|nr:hypothetical protein NL676_034719 [Syzygium grande]
MRSFPYDSAKLSQVWQSVFENLTGLVSYFPNGFDKFNEDPFRVLEKITNPITSTKECAIAAFVTVVVMYFLIDCLKKAGTAIPSYARIATNDLEKFPKNSSSSRAISVVAPAILLGHNLEAHDEFIIVTYFLIDCLKKAGTAITSYAKIATNDLEKFPKNSSSSRVISVVAPAILLGHNLEAPDEFNTLERFIKPNEFSSDQLAGYTGNYAIVLSSGSYKVVFKGKLSNGTLVVVKVFTNTNDESMEEQFMAYVSSIEKTHHVNLIRLYGFCFDLTTRALV